MHVVQIIDIGGDVISYRRIMHRDTTNECNILRNLDPYILLLNRTILASNE